MNRKAILLIRLLTDFRGYLAAGQWLAPEMGSYCFCHADFADNADFFSLIILVPQISRIHAEFFGSFFFLISINHNIMVYNLEFLSGLISCSEILKFYFFIKVSFLGIFTHFLLRAIFILLPAICFRLYVPSLSKVRSAVRSSLP